jgi:hypothetical protein
MDRGPKPYHTAAGEAARLCGVITEYASDPKVARQHVSHRASDPPDMGDIIERLRSHVQRGGGAKIRHGAWDMMLEAADEIERLRAICAGVPPVATQGKAR